MKKYISVYKMIQKLAEFDPDTYIEVRLWVHKDQMQSYEKEWETDDYIRFDAEEIDYKNDVYYSSSERMVIMEFDADDVRKKG